ncbi:MAG: tetratricopeptide repeat protein [Bacteroidia bacterium]|nr:tetratricopeptide repeat protein [Bacteroidia bacterium]
MRVLLFLSLLSTIAFGDEPDTSLARILKLKSDTAQVNELYKLSNSLRNSNPDQAWYYAHLCEEKAQISESQKHLAKSYNMLGVLYYKKSDLKKAMAYHQKALELRTSCKDEMGCAMSRVNLANIYTDAQLYEKAEENYLAALDIYNHLGDLKRAGDCLMNLGVLKQTTKQNKIAFENYSKALEISEQLNNHEMRARCLNNIAQIFFENGEYDRSIAFQEDALKIRNMMDNNVEVADSYLNLASNYIKLKQYDKAKYYLDTAVVVSKHYDYYEAELMAYKIRSDYFSAIKNHEGAYYWLNKYYDSKDSLIAVQNEPENFDFKMPEILGTKQAAVKEFNNLWLLISVLIFVIFVPLMLFRLKR